MMMMMMMRGKELDNVKIYKFLGCEIKFDEPTTGTTELNSRARRMQILLALKEYEKATNAKVNVDMTEALWVGKFVGKLCRAD